jgi:uncharacterized protein YndB with AHSA1/START domain
MKTTVHNTIEIDRPPEAVCEVLLDSEKAVLWTSDLERFEVITRTPDLVGSRARLHYVQGGKPYVMEDVMLEAEPNRRFLSRVTGDAIEAEVETVLTPANRHTLVDVRWTGRGRSIVLRLILPFLRQSIARQTMVDLVKLKALVEATHPIVQEGDFTRP